MHGENTIGAASIPVPLSTFVGRERESAEIKRLLGTTRLLTLVGTGGIGKTRLALEIVRPLVAAYQDCVWFVELASLSDPARVAEAVATAIGLYDASGQTVGDTLLAFLRAKQVLLVLDNCEHCLEAAATLAELLLRGPECDRVQILATSRQALGVVGETAWQVPSMNVPDAGAIYGTDEIAASEGVRLFCLRAQSVLPGFVLHDRNAATVAQICRHLDGIPLAIELAAARVRLLSPEQILARLDDHLRLLVGGSRTAPSRHQTLRATLDWSWVQLDEPERMLMRRLGVFAGGWTLEAAEAIGAGDGLAAEDVLEVLGALADRSLVVVELDGHALQARYRLLESVRQYAVEKRQVADEDAAVRARHAAWYQQFAERAEPELVGPQQAAWLDRLEREHDNLRSALTWTCAADPEMGLRIAVSLGRFWGMRGHIVEGTGWLERLLSKLAVPSSLRARALLALGKLAARRGENAVAITALEEGLAISSAAADPRGRAEALRELGLTRVFNGDYVLGRRLLDESLAEFRGLDDHAGVGWALGMRGTLARTVGEIDQAGLMFAEALELLRPGGDPEAVAYVLNNLGQLARVRGEYALARRLLEESLTLFRSIGATSRIGWTLGCLSSVALMEKDADRAERLLDEARALLEGIGDQHVLRHGLWIAGVLGVQRGQYTRGVRLISAGARYPLVRASLDPDERGDWDASLAAARVALGQDGFERAWGEGQLMTLEQAIAYGLTVDRPAAPAPKRVLLSAREQEVATLIAQGCSNREISARLVISERTTEAHVTHMLAKLGLRSRAQVAIWALQNGLSASPSA